MVALLKKHIKSSDKLETLLDDMTAGNNRIDQWTANREFFWPDGGHPNRKGHKVLFDHLIAGGHI